MNPRILLIALSVLLAMISRTFEDQAVVSFAFYLLSMLPAGIFIFPYFEEWSFKKRASFLAFITYMWVFMTLFLLQELLYWETDLITWVFLGSMIFMLVAFLGWIIYSNIKLYFQLRNFESVEEEEDELQ